MRQTVLLAAFTPLVFLTPSPALGKARDGSNPASPGQAPSGPAGNAAANADLAKPPEEPKIEFMFRNYPDPIVTRIPADPLTGQAGMTEMRPRYSVVTAITRDSITVQVQGQPPRRFTVSKALASGGIPTDPRPKHGRGGGQTGSAGDMYRLTDVKIGDWVILTYSRVGGVENCDHIRIAKRPGGLVPPSPVREWFESHIPPYHERMNAHWDLEDRGIAYPDKFGHMRQFPVAPLPREVPAKP